MAEVIFDWEVWNTYSVQFDLENITYSCNIWAKSPEHAEEVLAALKATGKVVGKLEN